ncbi:hypothetical protein Mmc1_1721 [Magnetococcus marinus MC-1]|uniref:GCN5-related N-acetyltransferase n=1 Tax=Magnetococcus marinus (strain ATCC BAA-1437 / JCM 17883 / MC-1) TaxID=156889 RepID=A0L8D6_MAGMM|nr:GNAT family protein [Magnetococcus marinus]ABK44229.1 hypothetical protein Mmc1_1721 [Magnetococcus marinus MC-1]
MTIRVIPIDHTLAAQWVSEKMVEPVQFGAGRALAAVDGSELLAAVLYQNYRDVDIEMAIAASHPRWAKRGVIGAFFHYPFVQLGCRRVTSLVAHTNRASQRLAEGLGFQLEGRCRQSYPAGQDALIYGLLKTECRWLAPQVRPNQSA